MRPQPRKLMRTPVNSTLTQYTLTCVATSETTTTDHHRAKMEINYIKGDATNPTSEGIKVIVHVCNDIGCWGKGFVKAISKRWKAPEQQYRAWFQTKGDDFNLGQVQFVQVEEDLWVANLIGQHQIYRDEKGNAPIRYKAILSGLETVGQFALDNNNATVHMPRIGCGLAGGTWDKIEPLIIAALTSKNIQVTVYDF